MNNPVNILTLLCLLIALQTQFASVECEFFSAVSQLKQLSTLETAILDKIEQLIQEREAQLKEIQAKVDESRGTARNNQHLGPEETLNPIEAYHRFKRLAKHRHTVEILEGIDRTNETDELPGQGELEGAIDALIRLRKAYLLPVSDLTSGLISSKTIHNPDRTGEEERLYQSHTLNANDCYRIAKYANVTNDFVSIILWTEQAQKLCEDGFFDYEENLHRNKIDDETFKKQFQYENLKLLAYALKKVHIYSEALKAFEKAMSFVPESEADKALKDEYSLLAQKKMGHRARPKNFGYESKKPPLVPYWDGWRSIDAYETLCRGEKYLPESNYSQLHCYYLNTLRIDPYYLLWKIQVEEAGKYPNVVQFHEVITDDEIEVVKDFANSQLKRATVGIEVREVSRTRVSQNAWANNHNDPVFERLSRRIQAITRMNILEGAEPLQIGNYGLGGHYEPHLDHKEDHSKDMFDDIGLGNRIATWMFYLSDVELGGATIFSSAGITVWPRKGSAAFWYNLRSSGNSDPLTRHAGCPVLIGSKWVANKWIHMHHQEFKKKCSLHPYEFYLVEDDDHHRP